MAHDWMLDVLADLKTYANKNGLSALADELDEAKLIAATEISSVEGKVITHPPLWISLVSESVGV